MASSPMMNQEFAMPLRCPSKIRATLRKEKSYGDSTQNRMDGIGVDRGMSGVLDGCGRAFPCEGTAREGSDGTPAGQPVAEPELLRRDGVDGRGRSGAAGRRPRGGGRHVPRRLEQ